MLGNKRKVNISRSASRSHRFIHSFIIATHVDPNSFDYLAPREINQEILHRKATSSLSDHFVAPSNSNMTTKDFSQQLASGDKK